MEETGSFIVPEQWTKRRINRNVIVISFSFLLLFTAFQALSNLQSSINCDAGLGLASLSTIYATLILSSMFVPSIMIRYLGLKWTLAIAMVCYAIYTLANYFPSWGTLIPASALVGFAAAPLWTAKATYLTTLGRRYAQIGKSAPEAIINRYFGIFFLFFQSSQIIGNLVSSLVLKSDDSTDEGNNQTEFTCGAQDCYTETGDENATTYCDPPDKNLTNILLSVYLACGIAAVITVALFVQRLERNDKKTPETTCGLFLATTKLMREANIVLLIPLTVYSGLEQAFITGDFTKSFVTCTVGVGWVGYIMICYGATNALFSLVWGRVARTTGRTFIFASGTTIHFVLIVILLTWLPTEEQLWVMFILAALWGVADAVWQTQINSIYGALFPGRQQAAFSNYRLWESLGFTVSFAYSNYLCVWTKLTILFAVLGLGTCCYVVIEANERRLRTGSFARNVQEDKTKL
ncbi:protein unc-93 homolog A-like [Apostichopus japonicus]|uniref:protein unc-93 homolog A-like n=1 Tax=Stichopus japonicus TaxID=307972 RepID=UPI003AB80C50